MQLSKEKVLKIRKLIQEAVEGIEAKEGCTIDVGTIGYSTEGSFHVTLKGGIVDPSGIARTREAVDYESYGAHLCHMDHIPLGTVLQPEGNKVIGYRSRARTKCIVLEAPDGRTLFATPSYVIKRANAIRA